MPTVTIHKAKSELSKLIRRAAGGEEVIIARGKVPVARLEPIGIKAERKFGVMRGKARTTEAFFKPLPESELKAWEK